LLLTLGLEPRVGHAYDFTPTDAEWQVWPAYCRARYVETNLGRESVYANRIGTGESRRWESTVGPEAWYALHHFCSGLARIERADLLPDKDKRKSEIGYAVDEFNFFLQRTPEQHPLYAEALVRICLGREKQGQPEAGLAECDRAIAAQPGNSAGYFAKATVLRRQKNLTDARVVLEEGNRTTEGNSAEVQYLLGLTCADLKDYTCAVEHGRRAYALGYPLPGLRNKLKAAGYSL
jgi:tetratricopeptide (TPR) repeat protein